MISIFQTNILLAQNSGWIPAGIPNYLWGANISAIYTDSSKNEIYFGSALKYWYSWDKQCIIRYNGILWDTLGIFDNKINALIIYKDLLIAAGDFNNVSGTSCGYISAYNGNSWVNIGNFDARILGLRIINDTLYVMGYFSIVDSLTANGIVKWDGTNWHNVFNFPNCDYPPCPVLDCAFYNGDFYLGGNFTNQLLSIKDFAVYKGGAWQKVGVGFMGGLNGINRIVEYHGDLYVAGFIQKSDGNIGNGIQKWDGNNWTDPGGGLNNANMTNTNVQVFEMKIYENELYISGTFNFAGNIPAYSFAKWNDSVWCGYTICNDLNGPIGCFDFYNDTLYARYPSDSLDGNFVNFIIKPKSKLIADTCSQYISYTSSLSSFRCIEIFPNPAHNEVTISYNVKLPETFKLSIFDYSGRILQFETIDMNNQNTRYSFDISYLSKGVYFIRLQSKNSGITGRFIKL